MLVEGEHVGVGWRVVGPQEGEVEVVLVDGDVQDETASAHSN